MELRRFAYETRSSLAIVVAMLRASRLRRTKRAAEERSPRAAAPIALQASRSERESVNGKS